AEGPEVQQDDLAAQVGQAQWSGVEPASPDEFRRAYPRSRQHPSMMAAGVVPGAGSLLGESPDAQSGRGSSVGCSSSSCAMVKTYLRDRFGPQESQARASPSTPRSPPACSRCWRVASSIVARGTTTTSPSRKRPAPGTSTPRRWPSATRRLPRGQTVFHAGGSPPFSKSRQPVVESYRPAEPPLSGGQTTSS